MHDARNEETWEPPKPERFRRATADLIFTEIEKSESLADRAMPALLGVVAGGGLAALAWYAMGLFAR